MIRKLRNAAARFVSTAHHILRLEAKLAQAEQQRDYVAELLTEERRANRSGKVAEILSRGLAYFELVPDGEPTTLELAEALVAQALAQDDREGRALEAAELAGYDTSPTPELVKELLADLASLEDALECANSADKTSGLDDLVNFRVRTVAAVQELAACWGTSSAKRKLDELEQLTKSEVRN